MRLSCINSDPGYQPPEVTRRARVYLDGEDVTQDCFTADEEKGEVWCYKRENGEFVKRPYMIGIVEVCYTGDVEIIIDGQVTVEGYYG